MIENKEKISLIEAKKRLTFYCPIGKDYYTADITMKFVPSTYYMDYMKLDEFLMAISGKTLTIEEAVKEIYDHLEGYKPSKLKVIIDAHSNTHLEVRVTKGDET